MDESPPALPPPWNAEPAVVAERGRSRRWFLAGGAAVLVGAGAGVGADFAHERSHAKSPDPPPAALIAAIAAERTLIADLEATTGGAAEVRLVIKQARADHAAHLRALLPLLTAHRTPSTAASRPRGTPRTLAELRAAEQRASAGAARNADALRGAQAALLASIAACEASHADLLR
jgi:hypothetical protein